MCSANALHCGANKQPKAQHVAEYRCHPCHGNARESDGEAGREMETQQMRTDTRKSEIKKRGKSETCVLRQVGERGGEERDTVPEDMGSDVLWISAG